jgi:hypothetical protein
MTDSTISAMIAASLPLTSEAVPCVQGSTNKQAPAAAFGIPIVSGTQPAALGQFQTWIDNSHEPARLLMYINTSWVELYKIGSDGTLTITNALLMPGDPDDDLEVATKQYVEDNLSTTPGALIFRGMIDCSTSTPPNYPAANQGDFYVVSVAGMIGGTAGANVLAGDTLLCRVNGTASGTQSGAGLNWVIGQGKLQNAAAGPATAVDGDFAQFDGTTGALLKDTGLSFDTDGTMAANSDARIPSQKAVKGQIGGMPISTDTLGQGQVWAWDTSTGTFRASGCEGRNLLANPSFEIWQETNQYTLSSSVNKTFIADFWKASGGNTDGRTVAAVAASSSTRPAVKFARQSGSSATVRFRLAQQFETSEALFLAGKNVTVSYDFFSSTGCLMTSGPYVTLYFGTGTDEDIDLRGATPNFPTGGTNETSASMGAGLHGVWQRLYSAAFAIPSNTTELAFEIHSGDYSGSAGSDDSFQIANVKMEIGSIPTPFRKPDYATELLRCQRRYQSSFNPGDAPADALGSGRGEFLFRRLSAGTASEGVYIPLAVPMYGLPAVTLYNPVGGSPSAGQAHNYTHTGECSASAADFISNHGFRFTCSGNSTGAAGDWLGVHYVADRRI